MKMTLTERGWDSEALKHCFVMDNNSLAVHPTLCGMIAYPADIGVTTTDLAGLNVICARMLSYSEVSGA